MAINDDFTLTNLGNSKLIRLRACKFGKRQKSQPVMAIPVVNAKAENNVLFRFFGQTETQIITFRLLDDGTDVSGGDSKVTVKDQDDYLFATIYTEEFDVTWTLAPVTALSALTMTGIIEDIVTNKVEGQPSMRVGTLTFKRGRIGALA